MTLFKQIQSVSMAVIIAAMFGSTAALAQENSSDNDNPASTRAEGGEEMAEQSRQKGESKREEAPKKAKDKRTKGQEKSEEASDDDGKARPDQADPGNKGSEKGIEKKRENSKAWWNFWG